MGGVSTSSGSIGLMNFKRMPHTHDPRFNKLELK
jgi:hypothetical protein